MTDRLQELRRIEDALAKEKGHE